MKKSLFLLCLSFFILSCSERINDSLTDKKERKMHASSARYCKTLWEYQNSRKSLIQDVLNKMTVEEKVCQLFIENLEGDKAFYPVEKMSQFEGFSDAKAMLPGGYLFFSYNLADSPEEIMAFTDSIRNYCVKKNLITPFLAVDQEGGFVNRLKYITGPLPSCERISSKLDVEKAYRYYKAQARQMKALGFDMNIAPVIEVCTPENEKFLNGRSFGSAFNVRSYGTACVNAYENSGIAAVIKHFPGNTNTDPHTGLPEINYDMKKMEELLLPFYQVLRSGPQAVLMSHARTICLDEGVPACFSEKWISLLEKKGDFKGIVFSDDIFMGALSNNGYPPEEAAVKAIEAGVDCIMISEKRFIGPAKMLVKKAKEDPLFAERIDNACRKIITYKVEKGILDCIENKDGMKDIFAGKPQGTVFERMKEFKKARQENIEMYVDYIE